MNSEKTILPSLRKTEWKTLKIETNKINHIRPYIPTNSITELNELIYAAQNKFARKLGSTLRARRNRPSWDGIFDWERK